jgi:glutamate dehydrogenase
VDWFYTHLGIDDTYFSSTNPEAIADHILALYGAKILAYTKRDPTQLVIDLERVDEDGAVFIHTSAPGVTAVSGPGATCEARIDELFLDNSVPSQAYRLETYRSSGSISASSAQQLRCYFVSRCVFPPDALTTPPTPGPDGKIDIDIRTVSDAAFLERATPNTLEIYSRIIKHALTRYGPVIEVFEVEDTRERRLVIGYKSGAPRRLFSALSRLYHYYGLYSARKYVEHFSCGITIVSLYLNPLPLDHPGSTPNSRAPIESSIFQILKEASLLFCLPENPFFGQDAAGAPVHAVQEATYAYAGWVFAQHFCNRLGPAFLALKAVLDENDAAHAQALADVRRRFREETFTRESIAAVLHAHPALVRMLYVHFANVHYPRDEAQRRMWVYSFFEDTCTC